MHIKSKKIMITLILIVLLVVGSGMALAIEKNKEEKRIYNEKIENYTNKIYEKYNNLSTEKDKSKKLSELKNLITQSEEYKMGNEKDLKVMKAYEDTIKRLKKLFKDDNNNLLQESISNNLEEENRESLTKKFDSLKSLNEKINSQENIVYTEEEKEILTNKIMGFLKQYEDKMYQLDKEAKDLKEKQEAEAKVKLEAEKKSAIEAQNQSDSNYSKNSTSGNNGQVSSKSSQSKSTNSNDSSSKASSSSNNNSISTQSEPNSGTSSNSSETSASKSNEPSDKDYGWSAGSNGENKTDTWVQQNDDGSYSAGVGKGDNEQELGGWDVE